MDYVMLTFPGAKHREWWERATPAERDVEIRAIEAWFREHAAKGRIKGGAELAEPQTAKTIRRGVVTDGPFMETKEVLGGFILLTAPDEATAIEIARSWPSLSWEDDVVEVRPEGATSASG